MFHWARSGKVPPKYRSPSSGSTYLCQLLEPRAWRGRGGSRNRTDSGRRCAIVVPKVFDSPFRIKAVRETAGSAATPVPMPGDPKSRPVRVAETVASTAASGGTDWHSGWTFPCVFSSEGRPRTACISINKCRYYVVFLVISKNCMRGFCKPRVVGSIPTAGSNSTTTTYRINGTLRNLLHCPNWHASGTVGT